MPVFTYGPDNTFPAFYARDSGSKVCVRLFVLDDSLTCILRAHGMSTLLSMWHAFFVCLSFTHHFTPSYALASSDAQFNDLAINTGLFFATPVPVDAAADGAFIQRAIDQAVRESEENGVALRGKDATPWLLRRVGELSEGKSLKSSKCFLR